MAKNIIAGIAIALALVTTTTVNRAAASVGKLNSAKKDILIKFAPGASQNLELINQLRTRGADYEQITDQWVRLQAPAYKLSDATLQALKADPSIEYVQPNYKIKLLENYQIQDRLKLAAASRGIMRFERKPPRPDNLEIPNAPTQKIGADPLFKNQWGMIDNGVEDAWKVTMGSPDMIVAVIDTGVDYTHEDLLPNLWRNKNEIPNNQIDDDHNGYVDDVIGWDFATNDNKPYDLSVDPLELISKGGNPGHGTHCAGNVAARGGNGVGVAGVAPNVKIMSLRFITEKGEGTTAAAIQSIRYAVNNGARVLSNSWGSEGEDPNDSQENKALREAVQYAQDKGVLFIAAAGNGHQGKGYDNDSDKAPSYPASYDHDSIISVAALDANDQLGSFSNWGLKTVDIGAPGVAVFSTTVLGKYDDHVINVGGFEVTWDGTSMATPHVAGAAALYWSAHPEKNWQDVKAAILASARPLSALKGKVVSQGKLDVRALLK